MKNFFKVHYESEIRLSLLLFILFFVLVNYGVVHLLNFSQNSWKEESLQSLRVIAYSASQIWQSSSEKNEIESKLKELTSDGMVKRVDILDKEGRILFSSSRVFNRSEKGSLGQLNHQLKTQLNLGKRFLTDIYQSSDERYYQSYFYPFVDIKRQATFFARAEKEVSSFFWVERISKYEGWVRGLGIFLILFLSLFLLKNIFYPYKWMKRKAEEEKIIPPSPKREDVEEVVEVFQKVIAELKEKEKKLEELYIQTDNKAKNLERYNDYILKSINNGVIICDNQGRITGFNQSAQRLLGPAFNLNLNLHYKEALGEGTSLSNKLDEIVVRKKLSSKAEIEFKVDKGEVRFLMADGALLRDENENIVGLVLVLTDLTELKKIQQEMTFKQKMASLGEISAGLAHELRNSMGALMGYCKILKKGIKEGSATYPVVESIMTESLFLENLVQRFLDFAKPLEGKWVEFDLPELLRDCMRIAQDKKSDLRISFKVEEEFPLIPGDPLLLRQVFQNLIQNSLEAIQDRGEIKIIVQLVKDFEKPLIQVLIQDNGCGIPEEDLGKIFSPFFTSKEKGIGLGLSLVKKIIDLHGGKIEVKSELGKGTAFTIILPLIEPQIRSKAERTSEVESIKV